MKIALLLLSIVALSLGAGAIPKPGKPIKKTNTTITRGIRADDDNGGLKLTTGFSALVFADNLGRARHAAVDPTTGTVFVKLERL
ncbi:MAG TPA: sorbosone dehydrogenase, partial [Fibrella sp.]